MGLILILLTGLTWGGIGVALGLAVRRQLDVLTFMAFATALASVAAWGFLTKWPALLSGHVQRPVPLILLLSAAGVAGIIGMLFLQKSMTAGAAAWTVGQSAMVIPFLAGTLFLGEPMRICGVLGVAAIVSSLLAFAKGDQDSPADFALPAQSWLRQALIAFFLLGIQQALSSIPSSWEGWTDTAGLRVPLVLTAGALPLLVIAICRGRSPDRAMWGLAALYATMFVAGQFLLFSAMDHLRAEGRLSLAFPLALGTCIVIVAIWDVLVWKRRPGRLTVLGISLGLLGVVLLAV